MIPKSGNRFRKRSCSNKELERDDDSKKSHPALRNNVRCQLVLDIGDAVAQVELALLEPLDLQLVRAWRVLQGRDCGVEVAMLLLQPRQLLLQLTLFVFGHRLPTVATASSANGGKLS